MTVNEWVRNVCEAALPQHHLAIETSELNWLSLLKLEPWDTFLPNTMVLHFSLHFLGGKCSFWRWLLKINEDLCGVAYFCLIYIYIPLLWVFFFWCILLWIPACLELIFLSFFFFKKGVYLVGFFLFALLRNHQILEQVDTIILWKNNLRAHKVDFAAFFCAIRNWWEKLCVSHLVKYAIRWESDGRKVPIPWLKNGYQFPRLF